ncbi:MAG: hypothetical protein ACI9YH_001189, partial [Colwellia sp.]
CLAWRLWHCFDPIVVTLKYTLSQTTSVWAQVDTQGMSLAVIGALA